MGNKKYFCHETAIVDDEAEIGEGTRIWQWCHIMKKSKVGAQCNIGENAFIEIDIEMSGDLTPQNKELVSTSDLVREIAKVSGKKILFTKLFNWILPIGNKITKQVRRAFADDWYERELSGYFDWKYCVVDFEKSIRRTEQ